MVLGDPAYSSASAVALRVLELASATGHSLETAFLYHKGAYAALNSDADQHVRGRWLRLAEQFGLDCVVCSSALTRITGAEVPQLTAPFRLGGLTDWLAACERSDRVLRFGSLDSAPVPVP